MPLANEYPEFIEIPRQAIDDPDELYKYLIALVGDLRALKLELVTQLTADAALYELLANKGAADGYASLDANGLVPAGQSRNRRLHENITAKGNEGSGEDTTMFFTVPGGTLANNGDEIEVLGWFRGNGADNVTIKAYWNTFSHTVYSGSSIGSGQNNNLVVRLHVVRTAPNIVLFFAESERQGVTTRFVGSTTVTKDLSTDTTLKFTAQNTTDSSDDAGNQLYMSVDYKRAA